MICTVPFYLSIFYSSIFRYLEETSFSSSSSTPLPQRFWDDGAVHLGSPFSVSAESMKFVLLPLLSNYTVLAFTGNLNTSLITDIIQSLWASSPHLPIVSFIYFFVFHSRRSSVAVFLLSCLPPSLPLHTPQTIIYNLKKCRRIWVYYANSRTIDAEFGSDFCSAWAWMTDTFDPSEHFFLAGIIVNQPVWTKCVALWRYLFCHGFVTVLLLLFPPCLFRLTKRFIVFNFLDGENIPEILLLQKMWFKFIFLGGTTKYRLGRL